MDVKVASSGGKLTRVISRSHLIDVGLTITLHKGTIMAIAEPVYQCSTLKDEVELEDKCECQCHCGPFGAKPDKPIIELCCHSLLDKQTIIGKYDYVMTMSVDDAGEAYREFEEDDSIPKHVRQL